MTVLLRTETLFLNLARVQKEEEAREKARREREQKEQSIKERQQKEADEAEKRRKKAAHADALANYMTLLNETVKDPEARWSEWKAKLQQDPQVGSYSFKTPRNPSRHYFLAAQYPS